MFLSSGKLVHVGGIYYTKQLIIGILCKSLTKVGFFFKTFES
jgi:hypothetical protein